MRLFIPASYAQAAKFIGLNTEANHQYNAGLSAGFDQNYLLRNVGLGYKFLKNNAAELRAIVFDLLGQNNSVSRIFTAIYNQDTRTNVLVRYYMLTFTYNLKIIKKWTVASDQFICY
jgi:hypothetical protein